MCRSQVPYQQRPCFTLRWGDLEVQHLLLIYSDGLNEGIDVLQMKNCEDAINKSDKVLRLQACWADGASTNILLALGA